MLRSNPQSLAGYPAFAAARSGDGVAKAARAVTACIISSPLKHAEIPGDAGGAARQPPSVRQNTTMPHASGVTPGSDDVGCVPGSMQSPPVTRMARRGDDFPGQRMFKQSIGRKLVLELDAVPEEDSEGATSTMA